MAVLYTVIDEYLNMLKSHYDDIFHNQDNHWWYRGMRAINESLLATYLTKKMGRTILDAGCGPGAMLPSLQKFGKTIGIDVSEDALKYARKRGTARKGDIMKLAFKDKSFDAVVCLDVLYHMWVKDEQKALSEFHRVLKKGGILVLREPAYNWMRGNEDRGSMTARRFSKSVMEEKLIESGFTIEKMTYANFFLFPLVLLVRLTNNTGSSDMAIPHPLINNTLAALLKLESKLMDYVSLPFGSSLVCIARKA
jgi:ubiquinone/menaquinone biosynthesis C-methylase UbiE